MLLDVNVIVSAIREDALRHAVEGAYVESLRRGAEPFGVSEMALSRAMRVLTHPRVFTPPTPVASAYAFVDALRNTANCVIVRPGPRHWAIFRGLLDETQAIGNAIPMHGSQRWRSIRDASG